MINAERLLLDEQSSDGLLELKQESESPGLLDSNIPVWRLAIGNLIPLAFVSSSWMLLNT